MGRGSQITREQKLVIADLRLKGRGVDTISDETGIQPPTIRRILREDAEYIDIEFALTRELSRSVVSGLIISARQSVIVLNEILNTPHDNPEIYTKSGKPIGGPNSKLIDQKRMAAMGILNFLKDLGHLDLEDGYSEIEVEAAANAELEKMGLPAPLKSNEYEAEICDNSIFDEDKDGDRQD